MGYSPRGRKGQIRLSDLSTQTLDETPRLLESRVLFSKSIFGFSISSHYTVYKNNLKTQSYICEIDTYTLIRNLK